MFKNIVAIIIAVALAACGGQAHAADTIFKATDGQVFGTQGVFQYEMNAAGGGFVKITYIGNFTTSLFVDGGSLAGRILQALPQLVNIPGTNTYIDPSYVARASCQSGVSTVAFPNTGYMVQVADNCALLTQIQQKAK